MIQIFFTFFSPFSRIEFLKFWFNKTESKKWNLRYTPNPNPNSNLKISHARSKYDAATLLPPFIETF